MPHEIQVASDGCGSARGGRRCALLALLALLDLACTPKLDRLRLWPLVPAKISSPRPHGAVLTLPADYDRRTSVVLIREVTAPTRANLDYAAYHANVMLARSPPEIPPSGEARPLPPEEAFGGWVDVTSITPHVSDLPDSALAQRDAMAFAPLVEFLSRWQPRGAEGLEDLSAAVRSEHWGLGGGPHIVRQAVTEIFVYPPQAGIPPEVWIRIEFEPWLKSLGPLADEDRDGYPEIYARARPGLLSVEAYEQIANEYRGRRLTAAEVEAWVNELASYWYPSYNTDVAPVAEQWPDAHTEAHIRARLEGLVVDAPTVAIRGKPGDEVIYNVFRVRGSAPAPAPVAAAAPAAQTGGQRTVVAQTQSLRRLLGDELGRHGGSWAAWNERLRGFHGAVGEVLAARDASLKAVVGREGFLFYRKSLEFVLGGDLGAQPGLQNPLPALVELKDSLAARGVDFLFVPVPTKLEVYPDKLVPGHDDRRATVVNPYSRKLVADLAEAGVEVVDLWPVFLRHRRAGAAALIYQKQDTHWTDTGLQLAAEVLADRIRRYPWLNELDPTPTQWVTKPVDYPYLGDLPSRLAPAEQKDYRPVGLRCSQVFLPDGSAYEDDLGSVITVIGDSFTGVFQRTMCRHAGVTAHMARLLGLPVDLVMSYGGGPAVRHKLLRRGQASLATRRLVVWIIAVRDLYDHWEDWDLLRLG